MNDYTMMLVLTGGVLVFIIILSRFATHVDPRWVTAAATGTMMVTLLYIASWAYSAGHSLLDLTDILTGRQKPRDELVASMNNLIARIRDVSNEEEPNRSDVI